MDRICSTLDFEIVTTSYLVGEFNSEFPYESIEANYNRALDHIDYDDDLMNKVYKLPVMNWDLTVDVDVAPYRNGSKVIYKIGMPIKASSNGLTTFDQEIFNKAEQRVREIGKS